MNINVNDVNNILPKWYVSFGRTLKQVASFEHVNDLAICTDGGRIMVLVLMSNAVTKQHMESFYSKYINWRTSGFWEPLDADALSAYVNSGNKILFRFK